MNVNKGALHAQVVLLAGQVHLVKRFWVQVCTEFQVLKMCAHFPIHRHAVVNIVAERMVSKMNINLPVKIGFVLKYPDVPQVNAPFAPKAKIGMKPLGNLETIGFLLSDSMAQKFINGNNRSGFHILPLAYKMLRLT